MVATLNKRAILYMANEQFKQALTNMNVSYQECVSFEDFTNYMDNKEIGDYFIVSVKYLKNKEMYEVLADRLNKLDLSPDKLFIVKDKFTELSTVINLIVKNTNIHVINLDATTVREYESKIKTFIFKENDESVKANIVSFIGMNTGVGTTMIARSVAENISDNNEGVEVLLLSIDEFDSVDYSNEISEKDALLNINFKHKAESDMLGIIDFTKESIKEKNLNILRVSKMSEGEYVRDYTTYKHILEICQDAYDLVIIDATNMRNIGNPFILSALAVSKATFLINDGRNNTMYFNHAHEIAKKFNVGEYVLINNKVYGKTVDFALPDVTDIGLEVRECIAHSNETTYLRKTIFRLNDVQFIKDTNEIVKQIEYVINSKLEKEQTKKGLFSRKRKKKTA